jgi:hypothetical protein
MLNDECGHGEELFQSPAEKEETKRTEWQQQTQKNGG